MAPPPSRKTSAKPTMAPTPREEVAAPISPYNYTKDELERARATLHNLSANDMVTAVNKLADYDQSLLAAQPLPPPPVQRPSAPRKPEIFAVQARPQPQPALVRRLPPGYHAMAAMRHMMPLPASHYHRPHYHHHEAVQPQQPTPYHHQLQAPRPRGFAARYYHSRGGRRAYHHPPRPPPRPQASIMPPPRHPAPFFVPPTGFHPAIRAHQPLFFFYPLPLPPSPYPPVVNSPYNTPYQPQMLRAPVQPPPQPAPYHIPHQPQMLRAPIPPPQQPAPQDQAPHPDIRGQAPPPQSNVRGLTFHHYRMPQSDGSSDERSRESSRVKDEPVAAWVRVN